LFPIISVVIGVLGVGFLVGAEWSKVPHLGRALILYAGGLVLLVGGIFLERKSRYQLSGRSLIGGGWAVLALVTYAIANVDQLKVLTNKDVDLFLLMAVIGAMVWHTLKYDSQVVTGSAFLLGFVAIGMNPSPPYNLIAGALLILGMTVIVVRRQWYELEVFGILASYGNHFLWLYGVYEQQGLRATFPQHSASVALVIGYWAIFRASYLIRSLAAAGQERTSTFAAMLNPILFLIVMKYQGFHPEWAWKLLLAMGAVEFILGQLPVSRHRRAPFQVLSSLGVTLMVAAPLVRGSGNALEMIWLAGAEAFLLAGIFTRERLFRSFGVIISFLVALYAVPFRLVPLAAQVAAGQPHRNGQTSLILASIAAALWANAHLTRRFWPELFEEELEQLSLKSLSFIASLFAVGSLYAYIPDNTVAVALAMLVTWLSVTGRMFSISEMVYEAHWIGAVAFIQVVVSDSGVQGNWLGIPQRVLCFTAVAALLYLSSRFVRLSDTFGAESFAAGYAWAGTSLLTLLIWFQYQTTPWAVAMLWIALGLALSAVGEIRKRTDLKWQAFALVLLSFVRALAVNFDGTATFHSIRLSVISVSLIALGIYLLARWAPVRQIRPVYTFAGTILLGYLAFREAPALRAAVLWMCLAGVLALAARLWKDRPLLWQTHLLSALATVWMLYLFYDPQYRGTREQWVTVGITAILLYALTWLTDIPTVIEDSRMCQAYPWAASLLLSWLVWYQLPANTVSLTWGIFGLLLFEFPDLARAVKINVKFPASWRIQAYVALACSFAHIFYSNFNTPGWGPAAYAVLPLVPIYFYIYWQSGPRETSGFEKSIRVDALLACLGTATLAAVSRFELPSDAVVIGYAALVVGTLLVAWLAHRRVFLFQALVMLGVTAFRISMTNFYHLSEPFGSSLSSAIWAIVLLACAVPVAFQVRKDSKAGIATDWLRALAARPELPMFFVPVALVAVLLFLKLSGSQMTGAWVLEGFVVFICALWAKERSFRWAGLSLVLGGGLKLVAYDVFFFHNPMARGLTWLGTAVVIGLLGFIYSSRPQALRDYL
jgi:hypothetical protein